MDLLDPLPFQVPISTIVFIFDREARNEIHLPISWLLLICPDLVFLILRRKFIAFLAINFPSKIELLKLNRSELLISLPQIS
jgi:hypothetical protein